MKVTKKQTQNYIKNKLASDKTWAQRAVLRVYERQTLAEQAANVTTDANGIGFSGCDAEFLSSIASRLVKGHTLSEKQWLYTHKKISKYSGQIMSMIEPAKLAELQTRIAAN